MTRKAPAKRAAKKADDTAPKRKRGRPSLYTLELADKICALIGSGETDGTIEKMQGMPRAETIRRWKIEHEEFCANYARARAARADVRAERIDGYVKQMIAGDLKPEVARVAIDAEKWQAGKEMPKRYGDKIAHVGGDEGDAPIRTEDSSDTARRVAFILGRAVGRQSADAS